MHPLKEKKRIKKIKLLRAIKTKIGFFPFELYPLTNPKLESFLHNLRRVKEK